MDAAGNRKGGKWFCLSGLRNGHYLSEKNSTDSWLRLRSLSILPSIPLEAGSLPKESHKISLRASAQGQALGEKE